MNVFVKICCIQNTEEANLAIQHGADAIGLVSAMPSGPGEISEDTISVIAGSIPKEIDSFLLTSKQTAAEIIDQYRRCKTTTLQIVDKVSIEVLIKLKNALPDTTIVQVIHVEDESAIKNASAIEKAVDAILLDSGTPNAKLKRLGGTGKVHNWDISRKIVQSVNVPVYLAGGLNPENVYSALNKVLPHGVDICSGIRTQRKLDEQKLKKFMNQIHSFESEYSYKHDESSC